MSETKNIKKMKAVRLHTIGDLRCDEMEVPVPKGEELLIRVGACGVCGSDYPRTYEHGTSSGIYPLTIGHEFAGEVVAVGSEENEALIGTKAAIYPLIPCRKCDPCVTGNYAMCEHYDYLGSRRDGGFAEYCLLPSKWQLIVAKNASMEELAMTEPACVAQHAVRRADVGIKMRKNVPVSKKVARILITIVIILVTLVMIVPFVWMISASFKTEADVMKIPIEWIPKYFYPDNYKRVLSIGTTSSTNYHFGLAYFNSIKVAVISTVVAITSATLAGYAFAKLKFKGSNVLFIIYLAQMMVPSQLTLIPRFIMFMQLGWMNTHLSLIVPKIIAVSSTFMLRQSFLSTPDELREAARIDGAGEYRAFAQVMLPLVKPTIAATATVQFLDAWNSYLDPLVFISNWKKWTIPLALNQFVGTEVTQYNLTMAACCMAVVPVFIVFLFGQKFFLKGLSVGAVKG